MLLKMDIIISLFRHLLNLESRSLITSVIPFEHITPRTTSLATTLNFSTVPNGIPTTSKPDSMG